MSPNGVMQGDYCIGGMDKGSLIIELATHLIWFYYPIYCKEKEMVFQARLVLVTTLLLSGWVWAQDPVKTNAISKADTRSEKIQAFKAAQACYSDSTSSGDFQRKVECAKKSLDLGYELFGSKHRNTAALSYNYALALGQSGALKLSSDELHKTVEFYKDIYGPKSEELAWVLMDLGQVESQLSSKYGNQFYIKAIKIFGSLKEFDNLEYANVLIKASSSRPLARYDALKAIRYAELAAEIYVSALGENSPSACLAFFNIGKLRLSEKKFKKAIEAFEKSLADPSLASYAHAFLVEAYTEINKPMQVQKHLDALAVVGDIQQKDILPIYSVRANYPRKAQQRGIEGYAIIKITVTKQGGVKDPIIIEERPEGMGFGKAALEAAKKSKYAPRIVDGEAVDVSGVPYKISFKMSHK